MVLGLWFGAGRIQARAAAWAAGCASALLAGAAVALLHQPGPPPIIESESGEVLLLAGCIASPVDSDGVRARFLLELEPGARARVTVTTRPGESLPALTYGRSVEVKARLRQPRNFGNPGAFDYVGWLQRQDVYWLASIRGVEHVSLLPEECGTTMKRAAMRLRERIVGRVQTLYDPDSWNGRVLPALLVGSNASSDRSWSDDFRRTGTYHALVVSGLHIAVVAGALLFLLRIMGVPLGAMLLTAAAGAWLYAAVVNWQAPAVRSAAGFTLFLVARWFYRRGRVLNLLAATVLLILAFDPGALFEASFQLTVLSVAAIGGLAAPVIEKRIAPRAAGLRRLGDANEDHRCAHAVAQFRIELRLLAETAALLSRTPLRFWITTCSIGGRALCWAAETAILSAWVQAALAVPLVSYFHTVSVTAVLANITVAPALTAAVPLAFAACATGLPPLLAVTGALLDWARVTAAFWSGLEPAWRIPDPPPAVAAVTLVFLTLLAVARVFAASRWWRAAACAGAAVCLYTLWTGSGLGSVETKELEVTALDVGQGDSILVVAPGNRSVLVDGGGLPSFDPRIRPGLDIGEDVVSPYLWRRGMQRLDAIAVTHLDEDHAGGLPAVIRNFRPRELWTGGVAPGRSWDRLRSAAAEARTRIRSLRAGEQFTFGEATVTVLAPAADYVPARKPGNDDSLVLLIRHGSHTALLTGDIDRRIEAQIEPGEIDILKVAHHGSGSSTSDGFLEHSRPLFGLISSGADNLYGHPHPDVLARLRAAGCRTYRTDKEGLVTIRTDGRRFSVDRPAALASFRSSP